MKSQYDKIYPFSNEIAIVELNNKYNYINKDMNLISKQWFDKAYNFDKNYGIVFLNNKFNLINKQGELFTDSWFDKIAKFNNLVDIKDKELFMNIKGEYILSNWVNAILAFCQNLYVVEKDNKYNFINEKSDFILKEWIDGSFSFEEFK
jgi:hypothetical protein